MNKILKYVLTAVCGALLAALLTVSIILGKDARKGLVCKGLEIAITDSLENSFVSKADIRRYLDKEYGRYLG